MGVTNPARGFEVLVAERVDHTPEQENGEKNAP